MTGGSGLWVCNLLPIERHLRIYAEAALWIASCRPLALPTADTAAALADYVRVASERRDDLALQVAKADEFIAQLRGLGGDPAAS